MDDFFIASVEFLVWVSVQSTASLSISMTFMALLETCALLILVDGAVSLASNTAVLHPSSFYSVATTRYRYLDRVLQA